MDIDELKYKSDNDVAEIFTSFKEEIESLKEELKFSNEWTKTVVDRFNLQKEENTKLRELLEFHKGVSEAKSIIIYDLEKQLRK